MSRFLSRAGEQVADLAVTYAEGGRLSRGRTLFRKGSVSDLSISEGSLIASVRGSGGDQYETTVGTALASPGVIRQVANAYDPENLRAIDDLIDDGVEICPRDRDLAFGCDCADWDELCKHVVAVLLAFADRVDLEEAELLRWRGIEPSGGGGREPMEAGPADAVGPPGSRDSDSGSRSWNRSTPSTGGQTTTPAGDRSAKPTSSGGRGSAPADDQPAGSTGDRTAKLTELEALLGDTVVRMPSVDGTDSAPTPPPIDPTLATFLGIGLEFEPVDTTGITTPDPLFDEVQLGPLADLGPELAAAVRIITNKLQSLDSD